MTKPSPCEHTTVGSEDPDNCAYCKYLAKRYGDWDPWEDATWD